MLTLCSEICHSKAESAAAPVQSSSTAAQPQHAGRADNGANAGARLRQPRASIGSVAPEDPAAIAAGVGLHCDESYSSSHQGSSKKSATANKKESKSNGTSSAPGLFGVMRQTSVNNVIQTQLKKEVSTRAEDLQRAQDEDKQRAQLIVALEREVFEKEQRLLELHSSIKQLGDEARAELGSSLDDKVEASGEPVAGNREKIMEEIRTKEAETDELGGRLKSLEEMITDKRAEVVAKGEATLKLLFELSRNAEQQRLKGTEAANPLLQAEPVVSVGDDAVQPL